MCKVLIIPAIKKNKIKETMLFVKTMGMSMSKGNSDGLGYAAINDRGDLYGERWFVNNEAFRPLAPPKASPDFSPLKDTAVQNLDQFGKALKGTKIGAWTKEAEIPRYNKFGNDVLENAAAITLHTRAATCDRNLMNVHPFVDLEADTSVIHNGVISNSKDFDLKLSTCDSESILISYLTNGVNKDIGAVQGMVDKLRGYYACGVFSRDADGNRILDVFKLNNNNLSICYIYDLETYVLTSSDYEVREVCKALGFSHDGTQDIHDEFITRINPFTGEIIAQAGFTKPTTTTATKTYSYPANYDDYEVWDHESRYGKKNTTTGDGDARQKVAENKTKYRKIVDEKLAEMWSLKSNIREFSTREVEEYQNVVGWE